MRARIRQLILPARKFFWRFNFRPLRFSRQIICSHSSPLALSLSLFLSVTQATRRRCARHESFRNGRAIFGPPTKIFQLQTRELQCSLACTLIHTDCKCQMKNDSELAIATTIRCPTVLDFVPLASSAVWSGVMFVLSRDALCLVRKKQLMLRRRAITILPSLTLCTYVW